MQSPEVSRINFHLLGVEVNSRAYGEIVDKILEGKITVELEQDVGNGAGAKYSPGENKMRFGSHRFGFREWNSYVVHEATHAIVDLKKIKISKIDDEAVAHVAHTLYLRRVGFGFRSHGIINKTWYAARDVADSIIRQGKPDSNSVKNLQKVIENDPLYHDFIGEMAFVNG